jgi:predicted transcriptional regulator
MERIAEGEYAVMEVLWERSPLTAAEVAGRVPEDRGWSLATVKTMLSRLLAKGLLAHEEDGFAPDGGAKIMSRRNRAACSTACSAAS